MERGQLTRLATGLYAVSAQWSALDEWHRHAALCQAALRSVPDTAVSHASAAHLLGLAAPPRAPKKVALVSCSDQLRTSMPDDWRRVLHGRLLEDDWLVVAGLRVTTPARTSADCLRTLTLRDGLAVADSAVRAGMMTQEQLHDVRNSQRRWPGVRQVDLGLKLLDGRRESWLESASVAVAWKNGLSVPISQISLHRIDGTFVGRPDLLWRDVGVIGEADGLGKYRGDFDSAGLTAEQMAVRVLAERDRERALESLGFGVARWTNRDLWARGAGLMRSLSEARHRARPAEIDCLWRLDRDDPLRHWSELAEYVPAHPFA